MFFAQENKYLYRLLVILIRVDHQPPDKNLRLKSRYMKSYKPDDYGLDPYLQLIGCKCFIK